jgi:RNA recognition motif-containing protein
LLCGSPNLSEAREKENMGNKLYVGNLPFSATDESLREMFGQAGQVESAKVITDRDTGRSKGFGFVEMSTEEEAAQAIAKFNGSDLEGRALTVNEARPMTPREGGGGGRGGFRGGGGGGGGRRDRGGGRQRW